MSPSTKSRVVVVGSSNYDLVSKSSTLPVLGETVMGEAFSTSCGGKGANQAVAAASLEISPVSMVCRVGDDVFGGSLLDNFQRAGVELNDSVVLKGDKYASSGVAAITVESKSGDNMIIVTPGANYELTPTDVRKSLEAFDEPPKVVVTQLEIKKMAALEAVKVGKELGAITILNPAPAPEGYSIEEFYEYTDIVIPNESELRKICGSDSEGEEVLAKSLLDKGVGMAVIVTLGARGAMICHRDGKVDFVSQPDELPCKNDRVVDTIGAGDAFCGSLSTYLSAGLDLSEAAGKACGFASMSVRRAGATYPTAKELPDMLRLPEMVESSTKPAITFVTGNQKKLEEVKQILSTDGELPFEITNKKVDLPELQGNPFEIATEKCKEAARQLGKACFVEDTSLCFHALNGMPGPYIKDFLEKCGHDGLNNMLVGFDDKRAYAQTVVAFTAGVGEEVHVFAGKTDGTIVRPRGSLDFGWDPIFEPNESDGKTYAEMNKPDKNVISHRGRSFAKFRSFLVHSADKIKASMEAATRASI